MTADAGAELEKAIRAAFATLAGTLRVEERVSRPWASITFSGERHRLRLGLGGGAGATAAADAFLDGLSEREFNLRGHILADIALLEERREGDSLSLTLEALTVEES